MRLTTTSGTVETSGLAEAQNFSIKVTGKAFKILLDGLYADKVAAVIRELCTNAYDAHLAIGLGDKPFDVQLPTIFDPTFRVRDYGVSMAHEPAMRLMSTVFESTKDNANNQVGAFGLGSKSPFALVDTFSLTCWKDGEKRMYSAFFGADGIPAIALLGSEPSSEPQGVQFEMTVDVKDVSAFAPRARKILRWFPTVPNVTEGKAPFSISQVQPLVTGDGWSLVDTTSVHDVSGAMARQGCVVYPLNPSAIPNIPSEYAALMTAPIIVDFPIGSLDVAASREALSYEPSTCANILARLNAVSKDLSEHYGKGIKEAKTLWEAGAMRLELLRSSRLPRHLVQVISNVKWQDKYDITPVTSYGLKDELDKKKIGYTLHVWDYSRIQRSSLSLAFDYQSEHYGQRFSWDRGRKALDIFFTLKDDRPTYEGRRIRSVTKADYGNAGAAILFIVDKKSDADEIIKALGNPPSWTWTSDIPAPPAPKRNSPAPKRGTTKKGEVKVRQLVYRALDEAYVLEPEKVVQLDGDAYYVISREGCLPEIGPNKDIPVDIAHFTSALRHFAKAKLLPSEPMYLISSTYQKRVEAFGGWERLDDYVRDQAKDIVDKVYAEAEADNIRSVIQSNNWCTLLNADQRLVALVESLKTGPLFNFHKLVLEARTRVALPAGQRAVHHIYAPAAHNLHHVGMRTPDIFAASNRKLQASPNLAKLNAAAQACDQAYPLIQSFNSYSMKQTSARTAVMQYIEAIDLLAASKQAIADAQAFAAAAGASLAKSPTALVA